MNFRVLIREFSRPFASFATISSVTETTTCGLSVILAETENQSDLAECDDSPLTSSSRSTTILASRSAADSPSRR